MNPYIVLDTFNGFIVVSYSIFHREIVYLKRKRKQKRIRRKSIRYEEKRGGIDEIDGVY